MALEKGTEANQPLALSVVGGLILDVALLVSRAGDVHVLREARRVVDDSTSPTHPPLAAASAQAR